MTELFLVRHGETDWNRERRVQGRTDVPLNDTGRAQARAAGKLLARREWDSVLTSPLSRASETAAIIARELGLAMPEPFAAAIERDYGQAEGLDFAALDAKWPGRKRAPGGETREQVAGRFLPALLELAAQRPGQALVIVSHGGAIRSALSSVSPPHAHEKISNTSIHSFRVVDGSLQLIAFDDPIALESMATTDPDFEFQNAVEAHEEEGAA